MSGLKYSKIQIEQEKKACQMALKEINTLKAGIDVLRGKVKTILNELPEGVKKSFPAELQKVKDWQSSNILAPTKGMNSRGLNKIVETLQRIESEGKDTLFRLIEIKEVKRDKKAKELIKEQEGLKTELAGAKGLLDKWIPTEYENLVDKLEALSPMIEAGEFVEVENRLNESKERFTQLKQECTSLEDQDNQRYYVLEALRKVCKNMGWDETKEPTLEEMNNHKSPLIYEVQTYYAGKMRFRLTLEGIDVDSPISAKEGTCYEEFDKLSEKLKGFGVTTKFERLQAPEEPKLIQKGELDLPDEGMEIEKEV